MANVNKVILIGNLTRDPEIRWTPKGLAVTDIGMAVNRNYTMDTGEKREETTFVDVTLWGRLAEIAEKYLHKGRPVYIEGRLQLDTWDDRQTGQKRSKLKVIGENLQLLGSPRDGAPQGGAPSQDSPAQSSAAPAANQGSDGNDTSSPPAYSPPAASSSEASSSSSPTPEAPSSGPDFSEGDDSDEIPF